MLPEGIEEGKAIFTPDCSLIRVCRLPCLLEKSLNRNLTVGSSEGPFVKTPILAHERAKI